MRCSIFVVLSMALWSPLVLAGGPPGTSDGEVDPNATMGDGLRVYQASTLGMAERDMKPRAMVCAAGPTLFGVDISEWQGNVDWNAVANDDVSFAFVRVSDGLNYPDDYFDQNLAQARAAGIHTGVYQFFRPNQDVVAQADYLVDRIGTLAPGDLPPVIDVEATGGLSPTQLAAAVQVWIDRVETRMGVTPIIYSGKYFWQDNVQSTAFADYPLWAAHYTSAGCPNIADEWSNWAFWQYTDNGSVAGVGGGVDSNDFNGSLDDLIGLTVGGGGECGDATCGAGETNASCPDDCPPCGVIPPAGLDIDERDACFFAGGDPQYWREESSGFEGTYLWTYATASATPANYGVWDLHFEQAGGYELSVYVESGAASSTLSSYRVAHGSDASEVVVNQSVLAGWHSLGEFDFAAGGGQSVRIDDNSGEDWNLQLQIVVDGLRVEPTGGSSTSSDGTESQGSGSTDGQETSASESSATGSEGGEVGTGTDASFDDETGDGSPGSNGGEAGCACNGRGDAGGSLALLALVSLGLRRRRL